MDEPEQIRTSAEIEKIMSSRHVDHLRNAWRQLALIMNVAY